MSSLLRLHRYCGVTPGTVFQNGQVAVLGGAVDKAEFVLACKQLPHGEVEHPLGEFRRILQHTVKSVFVHSHNGCRSLAVLRYEKCRSLHIIGVRGENDGARCRETESALTVFLNVENSDNAFFKAVDVSIDPIED